MLLVDIFSMILRLAELAFAAVVAGITGEYLHATQGVSAWDQGRHIYAIVVAAISIILALVWLLPFSGSFIHWPADFLISVMWFIVFGLLVDWLNGACGYVFNWGGILGHDDFCAKQKADVAFAFLSAICWLVSAIVGVYWVRRRERAVAVHTTHRRRWYRRSRV